MLIVIQSPSTVEKNWCKFDVLEVFSKCTTSWKESREESRTPILLFFRKYTRKFG